MKNLILIAFLIIVWGAKAQTDTVLVTDEPVIVNQEIYYTKANPPLQKAVLLGIGSSFDQSDVYYKDENFRFSNAKKITAEILLNRKKLFFSAGIEWQNSTYQHIEKIEKTVHEEHTLEIWDTTFSYEVVWKGGDAYYPNGYYDTIFFGTITSTDSLYTIARDTIVEEKTKQKRNCIGIPIGFGYSYTYKKMTTTLTAFLVPTFMMTEHESTFILQSGGALRLMYQFGNYLQFGPELRFHSLAKPKKEITSLPQAFIDTKLMFLYNF